MMFSGDVCWCFCLVFLLGLYVGGCCIWFLWVCAIFVLGCIAV